MISKIVSTDILEHLQKDLNLSVSNIAQSMDTTTNHIENIIKSKENFTPEDIEAYLKSSELHFWEFAIAAIPLKHLPEKIRDKVLLCQQLSSHIKKKYKK